KGVRKELPRTGGCYVARRQNRCAFLTYYSRDSAISAQNALHEKRTLPGPLMPLHSKSRPLRRENLISASLNKRSLVSQAEYCASVHLYRGRRDVILKGQYISLNRKVPSTCSVCATFSELREYRVTFVTQNCLALRIYPDTRELAGGRRRRCIRFAARPLEQLQVCGRRDFEISIYLVSDFRLYLMERPLSDTVTDTYRRMPFLRLILLIRRP
ncbi:CUGBP Elav-like family member 5, partial [Trachymyrmex septentrionalis]